MDLFTKAKTVRLRSHHDKYLVAQDDEEGVIQDRSGASRAARWAVEFVELSAKEGVNPASPPPAIRLKSYYGRYLSASTVPFLLGMTGRKVLQATPPPAGGGRPDSSLEWEPVREGVQVRLRTRQGNFLRANGGPPPWRNSVTHDVPHRTATKDWVLWDVDIVEVRVPSRSVSLASDGMPSPASYFSAQSSPRSEAPTPRVSHNKQEASPYAASIDSPRNQQGRRVVHYVVATDDDDGEADEPASVLEFSGSSVEELTARLREETGQQHIVVCTRSPLNGRLLPLHLRLPPANAAVSVVVVPSSSKLAKSFPQPPLSPSQATN